MRIIATKENFDEVYENSIKKELPQFLKPLVSEFRIEKETYIKAKKINDKKYYSEKDLEDILLKMEEKIALSFSKILKTTDVMKPKGLKGHRYANSTSNNLYYHEEDLRTYANSKLKNLFDL